ncbi:MAG: cation-translocating P-type ATPase [Bacillota bacterium]
MNINKIKEFLKVDKDKGLSNKEANKRLKKYGKNKLKKSKGISAYEVFIDQFKDIIVILLLAASIIAFLIGDYVEGVAVLAVILINAIFGFITEYNAEKSLEALKEMVSLKAKVLRDGKLKEIDAEKVVPGDIMILDEGDRVSADGRLLESDKLNVNESVLTGEAETVSKDYSAKIESYTPLAERENMVYMGTSVTRGNGVVLVTSTGTETEMGQISNLLDKTESDKTPLEDRLDTMGKALVKLTLIIAVIVTGIGILVGKPVVEMLKTGIALAIAAVPEGLPIVATITLAVGMKKMVKNNALVRRLPAVETLGSTTIICTDKTGTITENQMTLRNIYLSNKDIKISGRGYKPEGEFSLEKGGDISSNLQEDLSLFLKAASLCSNATLTKEKDNWKIIGDPTEGALVTAAKKNGFDKEEMEKNNYERLEEIPFRSEEKYMAVSYQNENKENFVFVKGAPSVVFEMCKYELVNGEKVELTEKRREELSKKNNEMAKKGLRLLAVAYNKGNKAESEKEIKNTINDGLVFAGLAGIMDPPRKEVVSSIKEAQTAGIVTKMITGDQSDTALSIAEKVGIQDINKGSISGQEIDNMTEEELGESIENNSVFSRVSPENKLQIINSLNQKNEITAMTGDGVNDAPALKKADIGIAMGKRGTSVAKSASDMVLLDDSFSTIVKAIKEGRVIFDNIQKFIYYLFSSNLSEIIFIFLGIVLQVPMPLLALQILWLNLIVDVFPALSLGWESEEENIMKRPPRDPDKSILTNKFKKKILFHSTIIALGPLITFLIVLNSGHSIVLSRTVSFAVLSFTQLFHVFNARRKNGFGFDKSILKNHYLWPAIALSIFFQLIAIYNPFLQNILSTEAIPLAMWPGISLGFIIPIIIIQILNIKNNN